MPAWRLRFVVFLYFVQTALLIAGTEASWLQWLSFLNFTPQQSGTPCPVNLDAYQQMALSIVVAMLFFLLLCVTMVVHRLATAGHISCGTSLQRFRDRIPLFSVDAYARTAVALFLYSYTQVTSVVLQYLNCVPAGNGSSVLYSSPTISCADETDRAGAYHHSASRV